MCGMVYQLRLPQPQSQEGLDKDLQDVYTAKAYNVHKYNVCSLYVKMTQCVSLWKIIYKNHIIIKIKFVSGRIYY